MAQRSALDWEEERAGEFAALDCNPLHVVRPCWAAVLKEVAGRDTFHTGSCKAAKQT